MCYKHNVTPLNGQYMWSSSNMEMPTPKYKKGPGRPKKLRRREFDENLNPTKLSTKKIHNTGALDVMCTNIIVRVALILISIQNHN